MAYRQYNVPMSDDEDARLREAAGHGGLGRFIREAVLEKLEDENESRREKTEQEGPF